MDDLLQESTLSKKIAPPQGRELMRVLGYDLEGVWANEGLWHALKPSHAHKLSHMFHRLLERSGAASSKARACTRGSTSYLAIGCLLHLPLPGAEQTVGEHIFDAAVAAELVECHFLLAVPAIFVRITCVVEECTVEYIYIYEYIYLHLPQAGPQHPLAIHFIAFAMHRFLLIKDQLELKCGFISNQWLAGTVTCLGWSCTKQHQPNTVV